MLKIILGTAITAALLLPTSAEAKRIRFAGYDFETKQGKGLGPGPNDWASSQAFVDSNGRLHLRFSKKKGKWYAGEIRSVSRFGFGTYEIEFVGDINGLDKNVVFGFFLYPTADVGPDSTNEIDIEFSHWGDLANGPLNYTVWPDDDSLNYTHKSFSFGRGKAVSKHRFTWTRRSVLYRSVLFDDDGDMKFAREWDFTPRQYNKRIGSSPMPVFFDLWGIRGQEPSDGENVEVIVKSFKFTPAN